MSAPKFTPGPWFGGAMVSGNGISEHITTVGGQRIASVGSHDVRCGGLPRMYTALYENTGDRLDVLNANARLIAASPDVYAALQAVHDWRGLCDSDANETFERINKMFWKDTGFMRPGKSYPMECPVDTDEQRKAWDAWVTRKNDELNAQIRAALAKAVPQ